MKAMKIIREFIALTAILIGMIGWAGDSAPFLLDTTDPLIAAPITYNSSWVGGDSSAEVVISDDGTEIKRTTGEGEFMWSPTTAGKHTLTYTTYINGVAQEEVYTATVYADWKYTIEDGKATMVETTQKSGSVTIPSKIDGFPVVGLGDGLFDGCEGLTSVTIPDSVASVGKGAFDGCTGIRSVSLSPTFKIRSFSSGLIQAKFNSSDDFTSSIIDSESKSLVSGVLMGDAYDTESVTRTYTDPKYGGSHQWNSRYTTFGYAGYMYMVEGRTYVFGKYFDDSVLVRINGNEVLKNTDHTAFATGRYVPEKTEWHEIEVRVADGTGEKGPKGVQNGGYWSGNLGVAWRDDGITDALPESGWKKMIDPGDGSLFRCFLEEVQDLTMRGLFPDSYDKLTNVTLIGDAAVIPNNAFVGCVALESFTIPDSVYSIGANAFANCTGLTNVSMPLPLKGQVESNDLFAGCSKNLEIVYRAAEIKNVVAKQRFPWNGKVDIKSEVEGHVNAGLSSEDLAELTVTAKDIVTGEEWIAKTLTGDTGTNEGEHHVVWDMKADGLSFYSQNIKFKVGYTKRSKYCVIDISLGKDATNYPVSYLSEIPAGGWTDEYKTTKLVLRLIEPGSFKMGGSYDVTLTKPYYMGVFEVTQKQYELVTGNKPSNWSGDTLPVERVSWNTIRGNSSTHNWPTVKTVDSNSFVGRLQARTMLNFDIPTEAQWEYACRAGTTTAYYWGDSMDGTYAWYSGNSSSKTHVVGTKTPNAWGLYDMSGNVWEACLDWVGSLSSKENPEGPVSGSYRMARGGSFANNANSQTSVFRNEGTYPSYADYGSGFRLTLHLGE